MPALNEIKDLIMEIVESSAPGSTLLLFGSRAKKTSHDKSDYDFFIIVPDSIDPAAKKVLASLIRKKLAENEIDADIIIQTKNQYEELCSYPGNVSHWVFSEGIAI